MKICMVMSTPFPPCDGIGYHVYALSKELMKSGHQVTVITRRAKGEVAQGEFEGIRIVRVTFIPTYPVHITVHEILTNRLVKGIMDEFDAIHYHIPLVPLIRSNAPSVVTVHSSMIEEINQMESGFPLKKIALQAMTRTFTKFYMKRVLNNAEEIIAVSSSVKGELRKYFHIEQRVNVVHNGVDTDYFEPTQRRGTPKYILYTGRLAYRKGLLELMNAFTTIAKETDANLILCGKGPLRKVLEDMVVKNGLEGRVQFPGFITRDELLGLYQRASVFVAASSYETGPLTVLEAMSCGIPVIVTRVGILPDMIEDGENGIFVNVNDHQDIASRCIELLSDDRMALRIGMNARMTMLERGKWSQISSEIESIYMRAIQNYAQSSLRSS